MFLTFRSLTGSGYIVVEPDFGYPLDGICCITHITKLLGPLTKWKERLQLSYEAAYNMIHLTPIQQLGGSNSAYSISDHLSVCDRYLPGDYKPQNVSVSYKGMEEIFNLASLVSEVTLCLLAITDLYMTGYFHK